MTALATIDRCVWQPRRMRGRRCGLPADLTYIGKPVCARCWSEICAMQEDDRAGEADRILGISARRRQASRQECNR